MSYRGDIALGATIDIKFTTRRFSSGAPYAWAGSPAVACYVDNGTTEITAGITLTNDFDSRTGLHNVRIVASSGNGYAAGTNIDVVVTSGTVDSVSIVGEVVGSFSIEARSGLRPTTAGRTLDVSSTGEAGVDWANVGSPTTTVNLSGTSVKTATDVETDTQDLQSRTPAALVSGRMDASVGAMASGVLTATAIAGDAITAAKVAADVTTELQSGLATASALSTLQTSVDDVPTNAELATALGTADDAVLAQVALVKAKTDNLPSDPADQSLVIAATSAIYDRLGAPAGASIAEDISNVSTGGVSTADIADKILGRNLAGGSDGGRTVQDALRSLRNKSAIAGGTLTVYEEDDTTSAWTATVTTAAGDPLSAIDPA